MGISFVAFQVALDGLLIQGMVYCFLHILIKGWVWMDLPNIWSVR